MVLVRVCTRGISPRLSNIQPWASPESVWTRGRISPQWNQWSNPQKEKNLQVYLEQRLKSRLGRNKYIIRRQKNVRGLTKSWPDSTLYNSGFCILLQWLIHFLFTPNGFLIQTQQVCYSVSSWSKRWSNFSRLFALHFSVHWKNTVNPLSDSAQTHQLVFPA